MNFILIAVVARDWYAEYRLNTLGHRGKFSKLQSLVLVFFIIISVKAMEVQGTLAEGIRTAFIQKGS